MNWVLQSFYYSINCILKYLSFYQFKYFTLARCKPRKFRKDRAAIKWCRVEKKLLWFWLKCTIKSNWKLDGELQHRWQRSADWLFQLPCWENAAPNSRGVGPDDLLRSLPTSTILWFCDRNGQYWLEQP